ncbi:MAG TPA: hypothetical protein VLY03_06110 [Bacteroidota bacterium]|nr:hypothetical protein [Bacteroidota bacterium]
MDIGLRFVLLLACAPLLVSCQHDNTDNKISIEDRLKKLESTAPGVGEVMSGVQLHFGKLYFAGQAENWKLADFELDEITENLDNAALMRPEEHGVKLGGVVDAFKQSQLADLKHAVDTRNEKEFHQKYLESMAVCNSCHAATGRPFIVITEPTAPPVSNQRWAVPATDFIAAPGDTAK